ncbi:MAG: TonB-dependent receptor plug domain-containing protein [Nitrospiraceae bacterium]
MTSLPRQGHPLLASLLSASLVSIPACQTLAEESLTEEIRQTLELISEEQDLELFQLGELVPSADQPLGPLSSVYEVTAQEILNMNARNVGEALRFVPGVIFGQGGPRNEAHVLIRGVGPRAGLTGDDSKYTVFIDGRPVLEPFLGTVDLFNLPVDNIAKIKVVKGPADAPYGANTLGGVINIVTKRGGKERTTRATVSYQEDNTQDYWLEHGGRKNQWNYYVTGSFRKSNGFPLADSFKPTPLENGGLREQSDFTKYNLSMNVGRDFNEYDKIALLAGYYKSDFGVPVPTVGYKAFQNEFGRFTDWQRWFADLSGEKRVTSWLSFRGKVYFDKFDNDLTFYTNQSFSQIRRDNFTRGLLISKFNNYTVGANLQGTLDATSNLKFKAGTLTRQDVVNRQRDSASPFENYETVTTDFFVEAQYTPLRNLQLTAGLNYDTLYVVNSFFARTDGREPIHALSPVASLIFKPLPDTKLHAAVGKKSNLPRMQNLFGQSAGNITLEPENNLTFEAGVTQAFWNDRLELDVTYFQNNLDHIIELQDRPAGPIQVPQNAFAEFANSDKYTTRGVDVLLQANWTKEFTTTMSYTYLNSISERRGASLDRRFTGEPLDPSSPMLERPHHQVNVLGRYAKPLGFNGFVQASYLSNSWDSKALFSDPNPQRFDHNDVVGVGGFLLINTKIAYEVWKGVKPFLYIENLLDSDYQRIRGFPGAGRSFFFGINAAF